MINQLMNHRIDVVNPIMDLPFGHDIYHPFTVILGYIGDSWLLSLPHYLIRVQPRFWTTPENVEGFYHVVYFHPQNLLPFFFCQFTGGFSTYLLRSNVANLRNVRCWRVRPSLPKSTPLVRYNQKPRNVKTGASYCGTQRQLTHSQINQQLTCLGEKNPTFPPSIK